MDMMETPRIENHCLRSYLGDGITLLKTLYFQLAMGALVSKDDLQIGTNKYGPKSSPKFGPKLSLVCFLSQQGHLLSAGS